MARLTQQALVAIQRKNEHNTSYGWPQGTINDLLDTIFHLKKEKKKWQRLAEERGHAILEIAGITEKQINRSLEIQHDEEAAQ